MRRFWQRWVLVAAMALQLLLLSGCDLTSLWQPAADENELRVYFLDVGQADAAVLTCQGHAMMIDGGNAADSDLVYAWLEQHDLDRLDAVVCTHAHEDHVGGLPGALEYAQAEMAYAPVLEADGKRFAYFLNALQEQSCPLEVPQPGDTFWLGEAEVEFLGPVASYTDPNNTSLVLRVTYGSTSFLFTGDMEQQAEEDLLASEQDLQATVLKVGHHGSATATSTSFLQAVAPDYGVISVGTDNAYGHPAQQVLERLASSGVTVYRTDQNGTVCMVSDGKQITVQTERGKPTPAAPAGEEQSQVYIGNRSSHKFHRTDCPNLPKEENQVSFSSRQAALDAGYSPCGNCNP